MNCSTLNGIFWLLFFFIYIFPHFIASVLWYVIQFSSFPLLFRNSTFSTKCVCDCVQESIFSSFVFLIISASVTHNYHMHFFSVVVSVERRKKTSNIFEAINMAINTVRYFSTIENHSIEWKKESWFAKWKCKSAWNDKKHEFFPSFLIHAVFCCC